MSGRSGVVRSHQPAPPQGDIPLQEEGTVQDLNLQTDSI